MLSPWKKKTEKEEKCPVNINNSYKNRRNHLSLKQVQYLTTEGTIAYYGMYNLMLWNKDLIDGKNK